VSGDGDAPEPMLNSSEAALQTAIALWCNAIARWYAAVPLVGPTYLSGGVFDRSPDGRLTFVGPYANRAGDGLISLANAFGRIVSDPALHLEACIRAAEDEYDHRAP
jgi:hypothetical protein